MVNDVFSQGKNYCLCTLHSKGAMKGAGTVELVSNVWNVFFYVFLSRHWLKWLDVRRATLRISRRGLGEGRGRAQVRCRVALGVLPGVALHGGFLRVNQSFLLVKSR